MSPRQSKHEFSDIFHASSPLAGRDAPRYRGITFPALHFKHPITPPLYAKHTHLPVPLSLSRRADDPLSQSHARSLVSFTSLSLHLASLRTNCFRGGRERRTALVCESSTQSRCVRQSLCLACLYRHRDQPVMALVYSNSAWDLTIRCKLGVYLNITKSNRK